ncbi:hypothetical protein WUBG_04076 [Wuchereria bancrofti]|uniref:Uncharacterized protein n=1 Tax=Wuchereria bancrofti TaxID=6293 RepID=J9F678_WUCBA|nr:hypothetical protein WUBG_04076 [Wuchereria bancrofti]
MTKTIFEASNAPTNIPVTEAHSLTISNIGDPLKVSYFFFWNQWDEILIAILLFVIALILFITGMYMVDRVQHGKDRSFRKYINEQKRSSEKKRKRMEIVLKQANSSSCNDTSTKSISASFVENSTSRGKNLNNSSMRDIIEQNISNQSII